MKLVHLFLFINLVAAQTFAQTIRIEESELIGVWQYSSDLSGMDSVAVKFSKSAIGEYSFLPSGDFEYKYFRITQTHFDTCLLSVTPGKWKLKNNELTLTYNAIEGGYFAGRPWGREEWSKEEIIKVNRDSFIVFNEGFYDVEGNKNTTYTKYYKRLIEPTRVTENGLDSCNEFYKMQPIILQPESYTFRTNYKYLVNSFDSTKVVSIPEDRNIDIYYEEQLTDSIFKYKSLYGLGYIDSIYEDSIIVSLYEMEVNLWDEYTYDGLHTTASNYGEATPNFLATIDLYNHPEIGFTTNATDVLQGLSAFGMASGIFTALIIAPLVSINYNSGEFRNQRYYRIAGYSLGAAAISLPVFLLSASKTYTLIPKGGEIDENHWYLTY